MRLKQPLQQWFRKWLQTLFSHFFYLLSFSSLWLCVALFPFHSFFSIVCLLHSCSPLTVKNIKKGSFSNIFKSLNKIWYKTYISIFFFTIRWLGFSLSLSQTLKKIKLLINYMWTSVFSFSCGVRMKVYYLDFCPSTRFFMRWLIFQIKKTGTSQT